MNRLMQEKKEGGRREGRDKKKGLIIFGKGDRKAEEV